MTRRPPITRPSYRRALQWIVDNDDTEWLDGDQNDDTPLSGTAMRRWKGTFEKR